MFNSARHLLIITVLLFFAADLSAQNKPVFKGALKAEREKFSSGLRRAIDNAFSKPLDESTQETWADAFGYMLLMHVHTPRYDSAVTIATNFLTRGSTYFRTKLLDLLQNEYPGSFTKQIDEMAVRDSSLAYDELEKATSYIKRDKSNPPLKIEMVRLIMRTKKKT